MNITYTKFDYDFSALKNDILYYINDDKKIDTFIDSLRENILYGAFSSRPIIKSQYDFAISAKAIEMLEDKLDGKKLFTDTTYKALIDKEFIGVDVDNDDFDTSEAFCKDIFEINNINIQLYPTFPLFDFYYEKLNELFGGVEGYDDFKWELYGVVEKFDSSYLDKYLEHSAYQYGGNLVHAIQGEYSNLIGMYHGDWGDCGAVYVIVSRNSIVSTVDMH